MTQPPPIQRRHSRQQLVLKVEFDDVAGFRSNFLSDLSEGGVRINTSMEVGQRLFLNISFLGFVEPLHIEAVVQWSLPATHPDGPSAGLAFIDRPPEAIAWLANVLHADTQSADDFDGESFEGKTNLYKVRRSPRDTNLYRRPAESRVLLLEAQPFLREIYGQEVRNWAELRDDQRLRLEVLDDPAAWYAEIVRAPATLGIIDADELPSSPLELYKQVRGNTSSLDLPLIVLGADAGIEPFHQISDDLLLCLRKPLRFGVLMNTVRLLARE